MKQYFRPKKNHNGGFEHRIDAQVSHEQDLARKAKTEADIRRYAAYARRKGIPYLPHAKKD